MRCSSCCRYTIGNVGGGRAGHGVDILGTGMGDSWRIADGALGEDFGRLEKWGL